MKEDKKYTGVLLFNLGGPDSIDAVEPFLYNLFCDPDIISFPLAFLFRKPLAKFISSRRAKEASEFYRLIGGKSPLRELTEEQAEALEKELSRHGNFKVFVGMRYWHPLLMDVAKQMKNEPIRDLVLLPLYPQYSKTTTGSSIAEWNRVCNLLDLSLPTRVIEHFYNAPGYIHSIVDNVKKGIQEKWGDKHNGFHILFSAHGLPVKVIANGDPYKDQIEKTVDAVMARLGNKYPHHLCYQSKVGRMKWLEPTTQYTIKKLASEGVKKMFIIPISFVSDHSETLYELDILLKGIAESAGVSDYVRMPSLNTSETFIRTLASLVMQEVRN